MTNHRVRGGSRVGYARGTQVSTSLTNQETVGGPAKAGIGGFTGQGPFATNAVNNYAPPFAGPHFPSINGKINPNSATGQTYLKPATDYQGGVISSNGRKLYYPINFSNQLSGVGGLDRSPFVPSADGVNFQFRLNKVKGLMKPLGDRPALL